MKALPGRGRRCRPACRARGAPRRVGWRASARSGRAVRSIVSAPARLDATLPQSTCAETANVRANASSSGATIGCRIRASRSPARSPVGDSSTRCGRAATDRPRPASTRGRRGAGSGRDRPALPRRTAGDTRSGGQAEEHDRRGGALLDLVETDPRPLGEQLSRSSDALAEDVGVDELAQRAPAGIRCPAVEDEERPDLCSEVERGVIRAGGHPFVPLEQPCRTYFSDVAAFRAGRCLARERVGGDIERPHRQVGEVGLDLLEEHRGAGVAPGLHQRVDRLHDLDVGDDLLLGVAPAVARPPAGPCRRAADRV